MKKISLIFIILLLVINSAFSDSRKWQIRKSSHFIVHYVDAPSDFIEEVVDEAEDYYREITYDLGFTRKDFWLWEDRAKIYIYEDAEDYYESSGQPNWSSGMAACREKIINTYPLASGFFDTLLPHELGHIIFREFVGFNADVPIWLDEGVACFQEKARRWGSSRIVKNAIKEDIFIPLDELSKVDLRSIQDKDLIDLIYAESASIVYFLIIRQGKHNFVKFCRALRDGKRLEEAIRSAYIKYNNLKELNDAWVRYLIKE